MAAAKRLVKENKGCQNWRAKVKESLGSEEEGEGVNIQEKGLSQYDNRRKRK